MIRPSSSPRAAKSASAAAIPGSTAPTSPSARAEPATSSRARPARPVARLRALQRSIADHAADADRGDAAGRSRRSGARGSRPRSRSASRWRSTRPRTGWCTAKRDLLPSLIVDRYGDYLVVQALSQGMDACCRRSSRLLVELLQPRGILARNDPQRAHCSKGWSSASTCSHGDVPETVTVRERASSTTSICGAARRPGCFSISARTARRRRATRAAGCSTASATTAASRWRWRRSCERDDRARHLRGRRRARSRANAARNGVDRRGARRQRVRRAARARAAAASASTRSCSTRRRSRRTRRGRRRRSPATRRSTCAR